MTEENRSEAFHIKLAGLVIRIEALYDYIKEYCQEYITEESACYTIRIEPSDIAYERGRSKEEQEGVVFSDAYLETLAVYRKIAEWMPLHAVLLFHGSAIAVDGNGYLFTAKSGTGKSTHTRLWHQYFGERAVMVNDDKPLLEVTETGVMVHGTPWNGKHRLSSNLTVPLKAICILTRDSKNHIEKITAGEAYVMLLQQCYRPADKQMMQRTLCLLDDLMQRVSFYRLGCNMEPEAAIIAYEGMKGEAG